MEKKTGLTGLPEIVLDDDVDIDVTRAVLRAVASGEVQVPGRLPFGKGRNQRRAKRMLAGLDKAAYDKEMYATATVYERPRDAVLDPPRVTGSNVDFLRRGLEAAKAGVTGMNEGDVARLEAALTPETE